MGYQIKIWFARVPASSNLADKPSRLETSELDALGVARDAIDWQLVEAQLEDAGSDEWGFKYGILVPRAFPRFAVKKGVCGSFFREFEFFQIAIAHVFSLKFLATRNEVWRMFFRRCVMR